MTFATNMQTVALNLLTKYGRSVAFSRTVEGPYDPITSSVDIVSTTSYTALAHPAPYTVAEIATGMVTIKDIKLLAYSATLPLIGDAASIDGDSYRVMNVDKVSAQGTNIIYRLQLRI